MKRTDDVAIVLDILIAAKQAQDFFGGQSREDFFKDQKSESAILYQFTIMGEAAKRLSQNYRKKHSAIPWKNIAGMRDIVIHQYHHIDDDKIWDALTKDVPELIKLLTPLVPPE